MTVMGLRTLVVAGVLFCAAGSAQAQRNYDVTNMNFDLWCLETQHWPSDRCSKRLPDDVKTFEAFRTRIESYEIPYLQKQNRDARLQADIIHNKPVDAADVNPPLPPPSSLQAPPQNTR